MIFLNAPMRGGLLKPTRITSPLGAFYPLQTPHSLVFEGAISTFDAKITTAEGSTFTSNTAGNGAGGGIYCSVSVVSLNGSIFTANEAVWGGGERCVAYCRLLSLP